MDRENVRVRSAEETDSCAASAPSADADGAAENKKNGEHDSCCGHDGDCCHGGDCPDDGCCDDDDCCDDGCGCSCGCGGEHGGPQKDEIKETAVRIGLGLVLTVGGLLTGGWLSTVLFAAAYLAVGSEILLSAVRNMFRGRVFDENLLMSVASVGAFCLGDHLEAVAVLTLYQVGELLQDLAVAKSRKNISDLMQIKPEHANLIGEDGSVSVVSPEQVPEGSVLQILAGERVPLDCVVLGGSSTLDTSALTGESVPVDVTEGDRLLSGSINLTGTLRVRTAGSFADSTVQRILQLVQDSAAKKSQSEKFITRFARVYTPVVMGLALLLAVVPPIFVGNWGQWLYRGLVFLVVSCPCALVISVPVGFLAGMGGAARKGILIKGGTVLDRLNHPVLAVFDKTGTLTTGRFAVIETACADGVGEEELLKTAALCESSSSHPLAVSVQQHCREKGISAPVAERCTEHAGLGLEVLQEGQTYWAGNARLMEENGISCTPVDNPAGTALYFACGHRYLGSLLVADTIRPGANQALKALRELGVRRLVMLTGDRQRTAEAVSRTLELDEYRAQLLPQDKVSSFDELSKASDGCRIFVGDGINDAPLLAAADVGFAMGALGNAAAMEAADCVLMHDDLADIAGAIRTARRTKSIIRQNIVFCLAVKVGVMVLSAFGIAPMLLAIFADVGVALLCVLNSMRAMR